MKHLEWLIPVAAAILLFCFDFYATKHKVDDALEGYDTRVHLIMMNQHRIESLEKRLQALESHVGELSLQCDCETHFDSAAEAHFDSAAEAPYRFEPRGLYALSFCPWPP